MLVPPGEAPALADGLVSLLEDEPRRQAYGQAARKLAEERYSWDDIARRLSRVYEEVCGAESAREAAVA